MPARNILNSRVKVNILNFQKKIPINPELSSVMKKAVRETVFSEKRIKNGQINVCLCDNKKIKAFNRDYFPKTALRMLSRLISQSPGKKAIFWRIL